MLDLVLCSGTVLDGSGGEPYRADVGIQNGKIVAIGQIEESAAARLDAAEYCVTPGFIDIHRHGDAEVFRDSFGAAELHQGLTTIVNGACGLSLAPFGAAHREELLRYLKPITGTLDETIPTASMSDYLKSLSNRSLPLNVAMMVGGGTVRTDVCGYRVQEPEDMREVHRRLEKALAEGAIAVSLGLGYAPECFYSTEGLIRALEPLRGGNIPIAVHMREEGDMVCEAIEEMLTVARALRIPLHISHLKAMGRRNWRKRIPDALRRIERARADGMDVTCDVYLYEAGSTQLLHLLPPDFLEGGTEVIAERLRDKAQRDLLRERIKNAHDFDNIAQMVGWDNIILSTLNLPEYRPLIGKTVAEASRLLDEEPVDCICRLLADEHCAVTMIDRINCEDDICEILRAPFSSVISDATYPTVGLPHPRVYATYGRIIEKYVLQDRVLSLPDAIHKITAAPAEAMRLRGKGRLAVGYDADINVFRPQDVHAPADFAQPRRLCEGIDTVIIGGEFALRNGKRTALTPGKVL